ncbi:autotransporter adhesin BpaC-like [Periophthalmus magnuspinnatus]|uniref:autotransporter adhesin BpaC-like n=1 Tax=Periophthalmus magnuspinnatus TaxID=409849 RepID=UPI002436A425|nr:autotransporter adhesin BpaC-like [Periophthalmus magnuspinnatus]
MAKKNSTKKSFKSLFSKSEVNLNETVAALAESGTNSTGLDKKSGTEKKKFRFPGLKIKSKSTEVLEKSGPESAQGPSVEKPGTSGESSTDNVSTDTDRSSLYATAPRSKGKDLSLSEQDLSSKPKRFNTFSLGLRRKKKREENVLSTSTYGIDRSGIELQRETPSDLSQMPLAQTDTKTMSKSQPELDTSEIFDIPSPPRVTINKSDFPISSQSEVSATIHAQSITTQQTNIQNNVQNTTQKAPIATIAELALDDEVNAATEEVTPKLSSYKQAAVAQSKVEKVLSNIAATRSNNAAFDASNIQVSDTKAEMPISQPALTEKQPEINSTASGSKMAASGTDANVKIDTGTDPKMVATLEEPTINSSSAINPKMATTVTDKQLKIDTATAVGPKMTTALEDKQSTSSNSAINIEMLTTNLEKPVESSGAISDTMTDIQLKIDSTTAIGPKMAAALEDKQSTSSNSAINFKTAAPNLDKQTESSNAISNTASASKTADFDTKIDTEITDTLTISSIDNSSFVSVATSLKSPQKEDKRKTKTSLSNMPDQDKMYRTLYDSLFPENFTQEVASSLLNQPTKLATEYTSTETVVVKRYEEIEKISPPLSTSSPEKIDDSLSSFSSASDSITTKTEPKSPTKTVYIRTTYESTSNDPKRSMQDTKFAYSEFNTQTSFTKDTKTHSSLVEKSPPLFSYATSQETSAQVSADSKRKVLLVKEIVANEVASSSRDSDRPTATMEKTSTVMSLDLRSDETEISSITSGQTELHDGICSPAYLSVGSDDGSTMEIFYSAEEDNADDLFTADDREATVIDTARDASALEDLITNRTLILKEDES